MKNGFISKRIELCPYRMAQVIDKLLVSGPIRKVLIILQAYRVYEITITYFEILQREDHVQRWGEIPIWIYFTEKNFFAGP